MRLVRTLSRRSAIVLAAFALLLGAVTDARAQACGSPGSNPISCENSKPGNPASEWEVSGAGDASIQGFAADFSVNKGETVRFKVSTNATNYRLDVYRMGFYGGMGARKVVTLAPSVALPQSQPACLTDASTGLIDCGNWGDSALWTVPTDAVSGIYFARLVRPDTGGASHVFFVVRDDVGGAPLLFQTSDTTWQAYNSYGGASLYKDTRFGRSRAYKVSYNRPFNTRVESPSSWVFNAEYPMVRWLEANGFHVSYFTGVDSDRRGAEILKHKVFLSVGHDEYWSAGQRARVEAARDAGVHLAFFSGNEVFWKTRWEPSIDGSSAPYRTLVCYKETHDNAKIDPSPAWTGTWRDPRFSPPADGGRPENALTGTIFTVNAGSTTSIKVPAAFGAHPFWRNTRVATLTPGETTTMPFGTLGYEWDEDLDNGFRPPGLVRLSSTTVPVSSYLLDYGSTYGSGTATHSLTLYRAASGALVFGAGTVQWSWGLDSEHEFGPSPTDLAMQQATVNLLADMAVQPATLQAGLVRAVRTCPCSIWSDAATPGTASQNDLQPIEVGVRFRAEADGYITALRFYKGPANTGTHVGNLWTSSGTRLATATFTGETASGWQQVNLPTPVAITANTTYVASYHTTSGGYAVDPDYFATSGTNNSPLRALRDGEDGPTGVYQYGPSGFPTQTFRSSNYWVDVVFDTTNPSPNSTLTVSKAGTGTGTVTSTPSGIDCGTSCSSSFATGSTVTLSAIPDSGSTFTGWTGCSAVSGATCTVTMSAAKNVTANFSGPGARVCPCSIWSDASTPGTASQNDTQGIEIGVRFRAESDGYITGLRFYKGPANSGTHVGNLWTNSGTLLATATFTGESASGWQQVSLPAPVAITANTTYVASYHAPAGGYAVDQNFFAAAGVNNPPVRALRDGEDGPTGVYQYGPSAFPTQTFRSTNYWVDVVFETTLNSSKAAAPTFSPPGGSYTTAQNVTLSTTTAGATIHYTTNGSTPTTASPIYGGPITVTQTITIRAMAVASGLADSDVASATYTIAAQQQAAAPTFSPAGGTYAAAQSVTLSTTTSGATIHFTTDGTTPTTGSTVYSGPIAVAQTTTIRAMAVAAGMTNSTVSSATYTITQPPQGCPCTIWSDTAMPALPSQNDFQPIEVGTRFRTSTNGFVTALRFFKGTANTGTHVGNLWTGSGTLLATATFTGETASGWQRVNLAAPVAITANTTYVVSYHTSSGGYAVTFDYFATAGVDSAPLRALRDGEDGPNGVYQYGAGGFPTSTFRSSSYWVDVVFDTAGQERVAAPTFNPPGGTYTSAQSVTLSTTTSGATIHYTTDGSAPTASSTVYAGPIAVTATTTIRAIAVKSGMTDSDVASATYTITAQQQAAAPTFSPPGGTYTSAQSVTLSTTTSGATIHYTTDGSAPTTASAVYTGPIAVTATTTIRAIAVKSGMTDSDVASATYTITPQQQAAAPTFNPPAGTYTSAQSVALSTATSGATIHYTTDGSAPTTASTVYTGPIAVTATTTIRAIAAASGMTNSDVASATYTILLPVATPTFSLPGGTYVGPQTVALSTATSGATIHYTTDGSTPTTGSTVYTAPIAVTANTTIRAMAAKSGMSNSGVATAVYTIKALAPTFSPAAGTYVGAQTVTLATATSGAEIRYTTDGSTPTASSSLYTAPLAVTQTTTIRAIAAKSGMANSDVSSATYTLQVVPPVFSPPAGTYVGSQTIALSTATAGATIHYTADGSTPTTGSAVYTAPIAIARTTTIRAIAVKSGMSNSAVAGATYTLQAVPPTFSPVGGTYVGSQTVALSTTTSGATIHYTTDGSMPTTASAVYSGPIAIARTTTIRAIAAATGMVDSTVASATYTLKAVPPAFSVAAGTYNQPQTVALSTVTSGATIHYTTNGTTPTTASPAYTGPISVTQTTTIRAIAVASGMVNSDVASATYTLKAATPTFSPPGGNYTLPQLVSISSASPGVTIYYTTDGSTPTTSSTQYTGSILVATTTTIKAIAVRTGWSQSNVGSATYNFLLLD